MDMVCADAAAGGDHGSGVPASVGDWKLPLEPAIAADMAALVIVVFMDLDKAMGAARIAALCGPLWVVLLSLSMTDATTRQRPPVGFDDAGIARSDAEK